MREAAEPVRVAFFTFSVPGHLIPALPVIAELVSRGCEVTAFASSSMRASLEAIGARVVAYPAALEVALEHLSDNFLEVAALLGRCTAGGMLDWSIDALQRARPGVVITDSMAPWGRLAAQVLGVGTVTSTSSFVVHPGLSASPQALLDVGRRAGAGGRALRSMAASRAAIRRSHGVACGGTIRLLSNRADATVVYTSRALQPGAAWLGRGVHFVGATAAERPSPPPASGPLAALLAEADAGRPLAYVSLGTLYHDRPEFLRASLTALREQGFGVVVSLGSGADPEALGELPDGVVAGVLPPQLPILDRAAVFVTHGGMNSVHEALWRGVPMVLFPQAADQPVVAARIQRLGAGLTLRGSAPGIDEIGAAAERIRIDPSYARRAQALGHGLRSGGGATAAADVILRTAARCGSAPRASRPGS